MKYCPDACPACGFVWGEYQGRQYGNGYEKVAAYIWRCRRCRHVVESHDPVNRRVTKR